MCYYTLKHHTFNGFNQLLGIPAKDAQKGLTIKTISVNR